jgi:type IV pilus assembly protein PilM
MFFRKKQSLIGLDIGSHTVKVVEIENLPKGGHRLVNYGISEPLYEAIVDGEIMDRQLVTDAIANMLEIRGIRTKHVVAAVSGRAVIVKKVAMNNLSQEDAQQAIRWEAEQHVPYDINDVSLDYETLGPLPSDEKQQQVLLVAAKKDMILSFADLIREAGLTPVVLDVDSFAIQNALVANYDFGEEEVVAILNLGSEITNINIIQKGVPYFTKDLQVGGNTFIDAVQRRFNTTYEAAATALQEGTGDLDVVPVVEGACETLATALERAQAYLRTTGETGSVSRLMLCGGGSLTPGLAPFLESRFSVPTEIANPLARIEFDPGLFGEKDPAAVAPLLTVGVGLALRKADDK